jgi:hypothetical protein
LGILVPGGLLNLKSSFGWHLNAILKRLPFETNFEVLARVFETNFEVLARSFETNFEVLARGFETNIEFLARDFETNFEVLTRDLGLLIKLELQPFSP